MADIRGEFLWYELMAEDVDAGKAFFTEIAGWGTSKWDEGQIEGMDYTMFTVGERPIGGLMKLPDEAKQMGAPPHWIAYIGTAEVDSTARQAVDLGGKLLNKMDIPKVGKFAILQDPQGAVFAAYTPHGDTPPKPPEAALGDFTWHELMSTDPKGAFEFYSKLFGWKKTDAMEMGPAGTYQMYGRTDDPAKSLGGMMKKPNEMPVSAWIYYFRVRDVNAAIEQIQNKGGRVLNGPQEVPGGDLVAQCLDPQGVMFAVHSKNEG